MSDHIPDLTKMIGETPRTDAWKWTNDPIDELYGFARQLERELNAANSKIELLMSANADVARIADQRDAAEKRIRLLIAERDTAQLRASQNWKIREEFRALLGTDDVATALAVVRQYQDRIKRLEEAGDAVMKTLFCGCPHGDSVFHCQTCVSAWDAWREAKEAKP